MCIILRKSLDFFLSVAYISFTHGKSFSEILWYYDRERLIGKIGSFRYCRLLHSKHLYDITNEKRCYDSARMTVKILEWNCTFWRSAYIFVVISLTSDVEGVLTKIVTLTLPNSLIFWAELSFTKLRDRRGSLEIRAFAPQAEGLSR